MVELKFLWIIVVW